MKASSRLLALACLTVCLTGPGPARGQTGDGPATQADAAESKIANEIGSLRNARVALPMPAHRIEITFFSETLSPRELADLARIAPNVRIVAGITRQEAVARAAEADGVEDLYATPEFLARATKLVWLQAHGAGVEQFIKMKQIAENNAIVLTNMRGVHGPAIADHAMAMLLALTRDLPFYLEQQAKARWTKRETPTLQPIALDGLTMLVVGAGGIGTEVARRAHGFGMHVIATRRSRAAVPPFIERVGQPEDLAAMLPEADVVAICVPLTHETERMFNAAAFAAMKHGSYLINVTRGKIVDSDAFVAALRSGKLAAAGLDVTDPEPLPPDDPLWHMPNVIITPHVSGDAELTRERWWIMFRENIRRFGAGEPLLNVVDKKAGY